MFKKKKNRKQVSWSRIQNILNIFSMGKKMHKPLFMTRKNVEWVIERKKRVAFKRIRCEI